jgi:glycosyltransferase involved in cell wall biosynthesis
MGDYAINNKAVCFTLWFRGHNNLRYADLFPRLNDVVEFRKLTLSRHRIVRGLQFRIWAAAKRPIAYPAAARYFAGRYSTVFTVDTCQIPAWPKTQRIIVDIDDPLFTPAEFEILKSPQVKAVVVTTKQAKTIYQRQGVTCPIHLIPQGVSRGQIDPNEVQRIRREFKDDRDLVVGYHAPTLTMSVDGPRRAREGQDDLDFLFAAVEDARKIVPQLKLWLIGEPSRSVKHYAMQSREHWLKVFGYVPVSDILNYVSNFDIGVYPRTWAQPPGRFNVKLAQFMACGVPIVSNNLDESFIVKETMSGFVCDSRQEFVRAVVVLAQSAEKRMDLGNCGRMYAQTALDWSVLVPIYKDIIKGCV